jgi:hypothetical protein
MPWNPQYPRCVEEPFVVVSGPKNGGDVVKIEYIKGPKEAKVWPDQATDPRFWPPNTGRPEDTFCTLTISKLVKGCYSFRAIVNDRPLDPPIEFECTADESSQKGTKGTKGYYGSLDIIYPTEEVGGTSFSAYGMSSHPLSQRTVQVGTTTFTGTIIRDGPSQPYQPWIVQFTNVTAGPGLLVVSNTSPISDQEQITVN